MAKERRKRVMELYEDCHDEPHYHLEGNPSAQNKIFLTLLKFLQKEIPHGLRLRFNNQYSVNIINEENQSYIFLNCYKHFRGQWRIKIMVFERGESFFENVLKPIIKSL
ncbi:MAG: hypothetical protein HY578_04920 [Nitrospinae bacterium]|nr:hypothetical protein [Nitrospinota bacterium]